MGCAQGAIFLQESLNGVNRAFADKEERHKLEKEELEKKLAEEQNISRAHAAEVDRCTEQSRKLLQQNRMLELELESARKWANDRVAMIEAECTQEVDKVNVEMKEREEKIRKEMRASVERQREEIADDAQTRLLFTIWDQRRDFDFGFLKGDVESLVNEWRAQAAAVEQSPADSPIDVMDEDADVEAALQVATQVATQVADQHASLTDTAPLPAGLPPVIPLPPPGDQASSEQTKEQPPAFGDDPAA